MVTNKIHTQLCDKYRQNWLLDLFVLFLSFHGKNYFTFPGTVNVDVRMKLGYI